jgi:lysophospholipase L1-like esterase
MAAGLALLVGAAPSLAQSPAAPGGRSLVALGDSLPGGLGCASPCRTYVAQFADLAAAALGSPIAATNLATNDGLTSDTLLSRVRDDQGHRDAIAGADIITLQVGLNDWQGACMFDGLEACLSAGADTAVANVDAILDEIVALRADRSTALRVVTYFDPYVGTAAATDWWGFEEADRASFEATFGQELSELNAGLCAAAIDHGGSCIDTRTPINGAAWDLEALPEPAAGALVLGGDDHLHLTDAGHALVAEALLAAGFDPLAVVSGPSPTASS